MPKLRNASTDVGKMAQYLARKCVIHSPQAELDIARNPKFKGRRFGKSEDYNGAQVWMLTRQDAAKGEEPNEFIAISPKGRAMKVTVEEVNPSEFDESSFKKVGT